MASKSKHEEWTRRVREWRESGLTAQEYAARLGVSVPSLYHWRSKLRAEGAREGEGSSAPSEPVVPVLNSFVEVVPTRPSPQSAFEVVLKSGAQVRVPMGFDAASFEKLMLTLERQS